MMPDCERWIVKLRALRQAMKPACEHNLTLTISPPATYLEVERVEGEIGQSLPAELRELFTHCAAKIDFSWSVTIDALPKPLPRELREVTFGRLDLDLRELGACWTNWTAWKDCFENPDEYEGGGSSYQFDDLFPLLSLPNGDVIALAARSNASGPVIYLSQEGGQFDEAVLADNLASFLDTWLDLGCPGPECWLLNPFYDWQSERLVNTSPVALGWKDILLRSPSPSTVIGACMANDHSANAGGPKSGGFRRISDMPGDHSLHRSQ